MELLPPQVARWVNSLAFKTLPGLIRKVRSTDSKVRRVSKTLPGSVRTVKFTMQNKHFLEHLPHSVSKTFPNSPKMSNLVTPSMPSSLSGSSSPPSSSVFSTRSPRKPFATTKRRKLRRRLNPTSKSNTWTTAPERLLSETEIIHLILAKNTKISYISINDLKLKKILILHFFFLFILKVKDIY